MFTVVSAGVSRPARPPHRRSKGWVPGTPWAWEPPPPYHLAYHVTALSIVANLPPYDICDQNAVGSTKDGSL